MARLILVRKGEEVISSIKKRCEEIGIKTGMVCGIGACSMAEIGYLNVDSGRYERVKLDQQLEVTSLVGNVTTTGEGLLVHVHVTLSDRDMRVYGGHLFKAIANPFLEVFLVESSEVRVKVKDERLGIYTLTG